MQFSRDLRAGVARGDITVSIRRWTRPQVTIGRRYTTSGVVIEIDDIELIPFAEVSADDLRRSGESDRESLRARAAHAGPVTDVTPVYRIEFHVVRAAGVQPTS